MSMRQRHRSFYLGLGRRRLATVPAAQGGPHALCRAGAETATDQKPEVSAPLTSDCCEPQALPSTVEPSFEIPWALPVRKKNCTKHGGPIPGGDLGKPAQRRPSKAAGTGANLA